MSRVFIDTNVLVYAVQPHAAFQTIARNALIAFEAEAGEPVSRADAYRMIQLPATGTDVETKIGHQSLRARGMTADPYDSGLLERAADGGAFLGPKRLTAKPVRREEEAVEPLAQCDSPARAGFSR